MNKAKHYCDNINCNHNDTKGLCCLFNTENCKYRQLQKENAELKEQISTKDALIKELQEQKVYWKESSFDWRHKFFKKGSTKRIVQKDEQLTKAKEIIKTCLGFMQAFGYSPSIDKFVTDAEQFLSEVEK